MNAVLVEANAEEMPFGNAFADLICCANVLSRLANPDRCLRELHRILKPNGFVVMCNDYDWSADYTEPKYWFDDVREKLDEDYWSVRHIEENVPYTAWLHGRKGITALNQLLLLQKN
jgi:ubiquinone/menaquinone biosynthesis C-methylase UbiE